MVAAGVAEAGESLAAVMAHSMTGGCDSPAASRRVTDDKSQLCVPHPACVRDRPDRSWTCPGAVRLTDAGPAGSCHSPDGVVVGVGPRVPRVRGDPALGDHGLAGEPGAHGVVQGVAVQAGQKLSQRGGVRRSGGQSELFAQVGVGIGGEAGDGRQGRGSAEDGDHAQREQGAQAVAAAPDPAGIGYPAQHVRQAGEL